MGTSLRTVGGTVAFPVPAEVAFDYLVDPVNRPEWQSSLASVTDVRGEVGPGQTWTDVTKPGLRPAMRTTAYDRPRAWSEDGTWNFVTAILDLTFTPTATGCDVGFRFRITGPGPVRALGLLASAASVLPVRADLRTAARILGERG
ncbi:unannotated protein [freshwater metagenome]|uniref:Unannotated protein n=1 Tax=freshwater metagenome TaxID=449393 RepID=A0A6J6U8D1_9ZZZZ|nr:SRPBCC family protein [Actinomycetota bacterium]